MWIYIIFTYFINSAQQLDPVPLGSSSIKKKLITKENTTIYNMHKRYCSIRGFHQLCAFFKCLKPHSLSFLNIMFFNSIFTLLFMIYIIICSFTFREHLKAWGLCSTLTFVFRGTRDSYKNFLLKNREQNSVFSLLSP